MKNIPALLFYVLIKSGGVIPVLARNCRMTLIIQNVCLFLFSATNMKVSNDLVSFM